MKLGLLNTSTYIIGTFLIGLFSLKTVSAQVTFEAETEISEKGLFFDGDDVGQGTPGPDVGGAEYDYAFGNRITPHGDCIKEYNGFVFMTWYRGGKNDRHVMLSRYNTATGVTKTIEFGHRHTGFLNTPYIGESHNTIAVGLCPIDGTIHLLYDMHSYSENRPTDGSFANDYFRYSYSKKNAATVPDSEFTIDQFVKDSDGDYKHLKMRNGTNYKSLTYPNFFLNEQGELFMWIREGGNTNGAYKFCKYNGTSWSDFTQFNVLNAKNKPGIDHNWGLYGDIKFVNGKMRIGFARRSNNKNDAYNLNNGFYYAYTNDPSGKTQWKDHLDRNLTLPIYDPEPLKASEPTDYLTGSGKDSKYMNGGADWTVTERGDIHSVTVVGTGGEKTSVHTYKKSGDTTFKTSTNFPGGNLYVYKNEVYLIGLSAGRVFVEKSDGGTNSWTKIYQATTGKKFRHGNVYISEEGKLYFYLMEQKTGSAQPIYLQILDLGLDVITENQAPIVAVTSPANNAVFELGQEITLSATASDADGSIAKVNFKIDDTFYKQSTNALYEQVFTPTEVGTYKIAMRAFDNENAQTEEFITISVEAPNVGPTVSITSPENNAVYELGNEIPLAANASDVDGTIEKVNFKIDGAFYRLIADAPYETTFTPAETGTYEIGARAFDEDGVATETTVTIEVILITGHTNSIGIGGFTIFPNPSESGVFKLKKSVEWKVYNLHGTYIRTGKSDWIDLSNQPKGIYFVNINGDVSQLIIQ